MRIRKRLPPPPPPHQIPADPCLQATDGSGGGGGDQKPKQDDQMQGGRGSLHPVDGDLPREEPQPQPQPHHHGWWWRGRRDPSHTWLLQHDHPPPPSDPHPKMRIPPSSPPSHLNGCCTRAAHLKEEEEEEGREVDSDRIGGACKVNGNKWSGSSSGAQVLSGGTVTGGAAMMINSSPPKERMEKTRARIATAPLMDCFTLGNTSTAAFNSDSDHSMVGSRAQKGGGGKKRRSPAVLMEGSRCSRVNGRGWRCCQQTLVGYSLCEHHLGKGRLRSMNSVRGNKCKKGVTDVVGAQGSGSAAVPSIMPQEKKQEQYYMGALDNGDKEDEGGQKPYKKGKKKIGMVKARSISSLLGDNNGIAAPPPPDAGEAMISVGASTCT